MTGEALDYPAKGSQVRESGEFVRWSGSHAMLCVTKDEVRGTVFFLGAAGHAAALRFLYHETIAYI